MFVHGRSDKLAPMLFRRERKKNRPQIYAFVLLDLSAESNAG